MTPPMSQTDSPLPDKPVAMPATWAGPAPVAEHESFVINLCSSTTPVALTQPQLAQLKSYQFFVSRRLEDGRERFRLHMGYFDSLLQAEELLPLVRDIYPGAWAGEAPGKRLRARPSGAAIPAKQTTAEAGTVPTLVAAPAAVAAEVPAVAPAAAPELKLELELVAEPAAPAESVAPPVTAGPPDAAKRSANPPFDQRSNVREVLKSLDESGRAAELPESQVLRVLEEKRSDPLNTASTPAAFAVQLQWSVQAIDMALVPSLAIFSAYRLYTVEGSREGRRWYGLRLGFFSDANSAKQVAQYVRSEFSSVAVVPVSLRERDGANGAQGGAKGAAPGAAPAPATTERLPEQSAEFKLLDDTGQTRQLPAAAGAPGPAATATARITAARPKPGSKVARGRGVRVLAHEKRAPNTLEETLEILGADQLQIEGAQQKRAGAGLARDPGAKAPKASPLSRLLDRLVERSS